MADQAILLKVEEAARLLSIGRSKLYELLAAGEIPAVHIGRAVRINREALEAWVREQGANQPKQAA